ncbi:hypothetical protein [Kiloniella antarctica]|uniref:YdhG-like domain-containing protein n=1 Tax=Kiloniella antarctica TaxID=1550907 RepID=A0ABW5BJH9_9PROT
MQFDTDLLSEHKELFLQARAYLLSFPDITEIKKERITTYMNVQGGICHMRTMPYGIDLGFLKGAKMKDDLNLLTGKGKILRVLSLKSMNKDVIKYYMDQAVDLNIITKN